MANSISRQIVSTGIFREQKIEQPSFGSQTIQLNYNGSGSSGVQVSATNGSGFYVYNNVGIAFRCFATGILFGLGSLFFLIYNGITIGTVLGHVIAAGHGHNILTFVCTHGTFELTAIGIAVAKSSMRSARSFFASSSSTWAAAWASP